MLSIKLCSSGKENYLRDNNVGEESTIDVNRPPISYHMISRCVWKGRKHLIQIKRLETFLEMKQNKAAIKLCGRETDTGGLNGTKHLLSGKQVLSNFVTNSNLNSNFIVDWRVEHSAQNQKAEIFAARIISFLALFRCAAVVAVVVRIKYVRERARVLGG